MTKEAARPFSDCRNEYEASLKAYTNAAMMLHSAVRAAIQIAKTPESALKALQALKQHDDAFAKAAFGDQ